MDRSTDRSNRKVSLFLDKVTDHVEALLVFHNADNVLPRCFTVNLWPLVKKLSASKFCKKRIARLVVLSQTEQGKCSYKHVLQEWVLPNLRAY